MLLYANVLAIIIYNDLIKMKINSRFVEHCCKDIDAISIYFKKKKLPTIKYWQGAYFISLHLLRLHQPLSFRSHNRLLCVLQRLPFSDFCEYIYPTWDKVIYAPKPYRSLHRVCQVRRRMSPMCVLPSTM